MRNRTDELVMGAIQKHLIMALEQRPYRRLLLTDEARANGRPDSPWCDIDLALVQPNEKAVVEERCQYFSVRVQLRAASDFDQNVFYSLLDVTDCLHQAELEIEEGAIIDVSFMDAVFQRSSGNTIPQIQTHATAQFAVAFLSD